MSSYRRDTPRQQAAALTGHPQRLQALGELWRDARHDIWVTLRGGSMMPTFRPGTRLRLRCDHHFPQIGDVIAFRRDAQLVIHRLQHVNADGCLVCQGDANPAPDAPVPLSLVIGVVVEAQPPTAWVRVRQIGQRAGSLLRRAGLMFRSIPPGDAR